MATVLKQQNFENTWTEQPTEEQCRKLAFKSMFSPSSLFGFIMIGTMVVIGTAHAPLLGVLFGISLFAALVWIQYGENKRYYRHNTLTYDDLVADYNHLGEFLKEKGKI